MRVPAAVYVMAALDSQATPTLMAASRAGSSIETPASIRTAT